MPQEKARQSATTLLAAEPMIFVTDVAAALAYYTGVLGFTAAFTHGEPPFYAQVRRDAARLNLRHVDRLPVDPLRCRREDLLAAVVTLGDADALYEELRRAGARFHQAPRTEPWGARTFIVADPDDNLVLFAGGA